MIIRDSTVTDIARCKVAVRIAGICIYSRGESCPEGKITINVDKQDCYHTLGLLVLLLLDKYFFYSIRVVTEHPHVVNINVKIIIVTQEENNSNKIALLIYVETGKLQLQFFFILPANYSFIDFAYLVLHRQTKVFVLT